jgi:hypothetical protein
MDLLSHFHVINFTSSAFTAGAIYSTPRMIRRCPFQLFCLTKEIWLQEIKVI